MKTLTVVAIMEAKPGQEVALRQVLLGLVPVTRQEPGCLNYDLHQAADDPGRFLFHENWTRSNPRPNTGPAGPAANRSPGVKY